MAHQEQAQFCLTIKNKFSFHFTNKKVLDCGSLDINGNNKYLFNNCEYLGIDINPGKNVDIVSKIHEFDYPDESFDTIISTECFEHDFYYKESFKNIIRLLKPNGLFLFTCATTGRPEHGTLKSTQYDSPYTSKIPYWANYYKNLEEKDIREIINVNDIFSIYKFSINNLTHDLYFWGIKKDIHNELNNIALKCNTDKSSNYHNYTKVYNNLFKNIKDDIKCLLEIGIYAGNSLRMWKQYFKNAKIYGIDIDPNCQINEYDIISILGNAADKTIINLIPNNIDIIIDNGTHISEDQITSFNLLFPKLKFGGIYIVEDACCSYWPEFNENGKQTTIDYFKEIINDINFFGYKVNNSYKRDRNFILNGKKDITKFENTIDYITFVNSLIIIKKIEN
jgi:hypothetical protein